MNVLKNECEISPAWDPRQGGPEPKRIPFDAIWDTGATNSVITQRVIDDCGLVATGMAKVRGVHGGVIESPTYLVNIVLPDRVIFTGVRVTKGDFTGGDILIGNEHHQPGRLRGNEPQWNDQVLIFGSRPKDISTSWRRSSRREAPKRRGQAERSGAAE